MSALGQKGPHAVQHVMSALPLKADMCGALTCFRFGPIADTAAGRDGLQNWVDRRSVRLGRCALQLVEPFTRKLGRQNKLEQRAIFAIRSHSQLTAMMFENHAALWLVPSPCHVTLS